MLENERTPDPGPALPARDGLDDPAAGLSVPPGFRERVEQSLPRELRESVTEAARG